MLKKIGMRFDTVNVEYLWKQNYNLAKAYYEKYGNLEIPQGFKTINGYEYDKNGIAIGRWLSKQRMNYKTKKMPQNRIKMLEKIGMCFDILSLEDLWMQNYNLAKAYYEKYGNLEISQSFKTINGCDYDERGIALGNWINNQRKMYKKNKLSEDRAKMLEKIGMRFDILSLEDLWMQNYNLAKSYYEKYGNLNMPWLFKTTNGYDYDENGINLWHWINTLRQAYNGKNKCKLTKKRIEMLEKIGMRFDTINVEYLWQQNYNLAKSYYEKYGNLEIPQGFKTINGYDYDENGIAIGRWLSKQRLNYKEKKMTQNRIKMLEKIGIRFNTVNVEYLWKQNYNLAKAYYEKYGNLEIPQRFKTTNGYDYDQDGFSLGYWIGTQRKMYKKNKLSEDRTKKLEKIGMRFDILSLEDLWMQNYNLAKAYYERYGNLEISQIFKTTNGYDYDENGILLRNWIMTQKQAYKGQTDCVLNDTKIKLLDDIHIIWFLPSTDLKLQSEIITEKNTLQKQKEILNRFRTYLNSLDSSKLVDKKEINNGFIKQLNIKND